MLPKDVMMIAVLDSFKRDFKNHGGELVKQWLLAMMARWTLPVQRQSTFEYQDWDIPLPVGCLEASS